MLYWRSARWPVFPHQEERAFLFAPLLAISVSLSACSLEAGGADVRRASAQRIVSLLPSATEVLLAIGAADRLIARTDYDTDARLNAVPSLGHTLDPTAESILALDPDLVILPAFVPAKNRLPDLLSRNHVHILVPEVRTLRDLHQLIDRLGALVGKEESARALSRRITARLDHLKDTRPEVRPTVLYVIWHTPPTVAASGSYIDEVIGIAGGRNVVSSSRSAWPQLSLEELLQRNPDFVVVPTTRGAFDAAALTRLPGWRELAAVKQGRLIEVDADLFNRPGPHVADAAQLLASALRRGMVRP